jgi:hypothetical protein
MADHTPGPWEIRQGHVYAMTGRYYERPVARVGVPLDKNDSRVPELEANCRLIASAPDLAEVVKVFLGHDDRFQIAVGGNPIAVEQMLANARACLARAGF